MCLSTVYSYFIVEDKAIFNYRLSRLAARWRIFRRPMLAEPDRAVCYTKAAIALHNFLRTEESSTYCPPGFVDAEDGTGNAIGGSWRHSDQDPSTGLTSISHLGSNRLVLFL